jgi:hypothetical protein
MEVLNEVVKSLIFVKDAPYFYQAMALVTIIATMIGSIIYNGDVRGLSKAVISIFAYGGMIMLTNISRIITSNAGVVRSQMAQGQAFNGTTTVMYVTLFYLIGIVLGVWAHKHARK